MKTALVISPSNYPFFKNEIYFNLLFQSEIFISVYQSQYVSTIITYNCKVALCIRVHGTFTGMRTHDALFCLRCSTVEEKRNRHSHAVVD